MRHRGHRCHDCVPDGSPPRWLFDLQQVREHYEDYCKSVRPMGLTQTVQEQAGPRNEAWRRLYDGGGSHRHRRRRSRQGGPVPDSDANWERHRLIRRRNHRDRKRAQSQRIATFRCQNLFRKRNEYGERSVASRNLNDLTACENPKRLNSTQRNGSQPHGCRDDSTIQRAVKLASGGPR